MGRRSVLLEVAVQHEADGSGEWYPWETAATLDASETSHIIGIEPGLCYKFRLDGGETQLAPRSRRQSFLPASTSHRRHRHLHHHRRLLPRTTSCHGQDVRTDNQCQTRSFRIGRPAHRLLVAWRAPPVRRVPTVRGRITASAILAHRGRDRWDWPNGEALAP